MKDRVTNLNKLKLLAALLSLTLAVKNPARAESSESDFTCTREVVANSKQVVAEVEKRYQKLSGITAHFAQESYFAGLERREKSSGRLSFLKPGKMDWQYELPEVQRFVADGKSLWYYQPASNQVTLADFKDSFQTDLPVSFLLGIGRLSDRFNLKNVCYSTGGLLLALEPKEADPSLDRFDLLVRRSDYVASGAKVVDIGGNETTIRFSKLELDPKLSVSQFNFSAPLGVDIIDRRDPLRVELVPEPPRKSSVTEKDL